MSKPYIEDVLVVALLKEEIKKRYDILDTLVKAMFTNYGEGRFDYDLINETNIELTEDVEEFVEELLKKGDYLKFEMTDNLKKMADEGKLFTSTSVKPISFETKSLKNCPDSLKE